jgi:hypothetical protein
MKTTIRLSESQLDVFRAGHRIEDSEGSIYYHYPYWIRPIDSMDESGKHNCEVLYRSEIPTIEAGYRKGGIKKNKYVISKGDGSPVDPHAWYFVLRIDEDPHAQAAARAYCLSVQDDNPALAIELLDAIESYDPTLHSSAEWQIYYPYLILDPDGWDRKNYEKSWAEQITWKEFQNRAAKSTCILKSKADD